MTAGTPAAPAPSDPDLETLAHHYATIVGRREEIDREYKELQQALIKALRALPERAVVLPGGRYRLLEREGIEELVWEETGQKQ